MHSISNEDLFWLSDKKEGLNACASEAIALKRLAIAYFKNEILPTLDNLNGRILEIAAGSCWLSSILKNNFPSAIIISSDISSNAMKKGIQVSKIFNCKMDTYMGCIAEKLPFKDGTFDWVNRLPR